MKLFYLFVSLLFPLAAFAGNPPPALNICSTLLMSAGVHSDEDATSSVVEAYSQILSHLPEAAFSKAVVERMDSTQDFFLFPENLSSADDHALRALSQLKELVEARFPVGSLVRKELDSLLRKNVLSFLAAEESRSQALKEKAAVGVLCFDLQAPLIEERRMVFSRDGKTAFASDASGQGAIWRKGGAPEWILLKEKVLADMIQLSNDGKRAFAVTRKNLYIWNSDTGELLGNPAVETKYDLPALDIADDDKSVAVEHWNIYSMKDLLRARGDERVPSREIPEHTGYLCGFSWNERVAVTKKTNGEIFLHSWRGNCTRREIKLPLSTMWGEGIAVDQKTSRIAIWDRAKHQVALFDRKGKEAIARIDIGVEALNRASHAFSPDGKQLSIVLDPTRIRIVDLQTKKIELIEVPAERNSSLSAKFALDGSLLLVTSENTSAPYTKKYMIIDLETKELNFKFKGARALTLLRDGRHLVEWIEVGKRRVWDLKELFLK